MSKEMYNFQTPPPPKSNEENNPVESRMEKGERETHKAEEGRGPRKIILTGNRTKQKNKFRYISHH